ncbi:CvpA family protein [Anoxynatronum buryatiense]|uniref:Colicin V production protein n=1 Tax=Anoxynatronum buryatiense TaxID=489973 RepID=A0AA46AJ69_9CLOT|nr:CvpA family protein [Anoxynatronum buryatiense]SMP58459.1 Colicin V production protein [Anoxynatronum buryatiense]
MGFNWVDGVMLALMGFNLIRGYQRGLVLTLTSLASYVAGWLAALTYSEQVAVYVQATPSLYNPLFRWVYDFLEKRSDFSQATHLAEETLVEKWLTLPIPGMAREWLHQTDALADMQAVEGLVQQTEAWFLHQAATAITQMVVSLIAFVLVFLVVKHGVYLLGLLLHGLFQLPVLSAFNRFTGLLAGLVRGVILIWLLTLLITPWVAASPQGMLAEGLRQSQLLEQFPWISVVKVETAAESNQREEAPPV